MSFHNLMARLKQDSNRLTTKFHKCSQHIVSLSKNQSKEQWLFEKKALMPETSVLQLLTNQEKMVERVTLC
jgi:hypothetical protein